MIDRSDIVEALKRMRSMLPNEILPADPVGLRQLLELVPNLPIDVGHIYAEIGGMKRNRRISFSLMTPKDVAHTIELFRRSPINPDDFTAYGAPMWEFGDGYRCLQLFTDFNGNHLGVHLKKPLAPRGFSFDHEESTFEPTFRSIGHIIHALLDRLDCDDDYIGDMQEDYPVSNAELVDQEDRELSLKLLKEYKADPIDQRIKVLSAIRLSHPDDMGEFVWLIGDSDSWVSEKICILVGERRYLPAIPRMVEAAIAKGGNTALAAIVALRDWDHLEAIRACNDLKERLSEGYRLYFKTSTNQSL